MMKIMVLTDIPSPYQVELFNALDTSDGIEIYVIYRRRRDPGRAWDDTLIAHPHLFLEEAEWIAVSRRIIECDLAVFGGYRSSAVSRLIRMRNKTGAAWAFWGERPGF